MHKASGPGGASFRDYAAKSRLDLRLEVKRQDPKGTQPIGTAIALGKGAACEQGLKRQSQRD